MAKHLSIGQLCKEFKLARSTLLHYEKLGLLSPEKSRDNGYREYSKFDYERLQKIVEYRKAGLSLKSLSILLDATGERASAEQRLFSNRLNAISEEIRHLQAQQQLILKLLGSEDRKEETLTKESWVAMLSEAGMTDADMWRWHEAFERDSPRAHQQFLENIGVDRDEISQIREKSRAR
jgi:DNA-binding transcriptional MerR regulator